MRILTLVGSYRKKGNTARIVHMIASHLETLAARAGQPLAFETLYLGDLDLQPCRGCRTCFDRGEDKCPLKDDLPSIRARLDAADAVVLASPVYVDDVSGVVKTWIDRLAYVCHRPAFAGKVAYTIATVAGSPTGHTLRTMNMALLTWGFHLAGQAGYKLGALASAEELETHRRQTERAAETLFRAISQGQALRPSFLSLMMFMIQQLAWQQEPPDSYDYTYWHGRGWLAPGRTFYVEHRANPAKVALARLVGAAISRWMS